MKQYKELVKHVLDNGTTRGDRTGTGTKSIFGAQMRFNLNDGFPIVTTRYINHKVFCEEIIWMITQPTNTQWLNDKGLKFWDAWADDNKNLGPIYNHQFTNFGGKWDNIPSKPIKPIRYFDDLGVDSDILESNSYGTYKIIKLLEDRCTIQFCDTGFVNNVRLDHAKRGEVRDPYYPSKHGAGHLGDYYINKDNYDFSYTDKAYTVWQGMINRCYDKNKDTYAYYGGKGVYVCDRWLNFTNFLLDVPYIDGWDEFTNTEIDKDIVGNGFVYGPNSCMFVSKSDNQAHKNGKKYIIENTNTGAIASFVNSTKFRDKNGIKNQGNFDAMLRGERNICEGWVLLEVIDITKGVNQIDYIMDSLKKFPDSRRHVMTLWNPVDLDYQALACCHGTVIQFYINDGKLSCHMYQRSCDVLIGLPHNIGEYSLLTHMIAAQLGLGVGEFVWTGGDVHIYLNHIDKLDDYLEREPMELPKLKLNPDVKSIYDYTMDDIEFVGYEHHPHIKFPIAV